MTRLKDKKIVFLGIILVVFTIGYFAIANKISYAFSNDYDFQKAYNRMIETIEKCAIAYGENNIELLKDEKTLYIKVQDLIDNNLLVPNESGNIVNPLNAKENLNSNLIKLKYENKEITVEIDS